MAEPARIIDNKVFIGGEESLVNEITIGRATDTVVIAGAQTLEGAQTFSGVVTFGDTATFEGAVAVEADITMADAIDIVVDTTTGTVIATAVGQKLGFWGATPVIQQADAAQVAPASYTTGAFGLDSDANMQALFDLVVEIRAALVATGIIKGAA